ncbi:tetratricopeptide repeat protein [Schlesneria paludicola]|uniref:tetratricopeptide repeat protein n=1 Tax=Schlesneria paludicola TaxID=360056 RepID=UPI00029AFE2C|nr:tetratricopeptide repeat protein [Schlesneria paludicola]
MLARILIVLVLCAGTSTVAAQPNPEHEKLRADTKAAYEEGDFEETKELANKILAQNPKDHVAMYLRASAKVELGVLKHDVKEIREGIEDSRESIKIGGSEINYYLPYLYGMVSLATIEDKKEHANVALTVAKTVLGKPTLTGEQRANVLYQRAQAYLYLKDLNAAISDYQDAIKSFPGHIGSYMGLAHCYIIDGKPDKALATFTSAVETLPDNKLVHNNRGLFLQQQGKPQEALKDFNKAIALDGEFATAYTNRGFTLQGQGQLAEAEADFTKAISLMPENPLFASLRGTCRLSQGNTAGAIEDYTKAIQLNPQNPVAHADLGFAKFFSRDFAGAFTAFDESTKIDANVMRYLSPWKAWSLVLSGRPDAVAEVAEASASKPEKDRDWIDEQVLFLNGKISEKELVEFVNKTPDPKLKSAQMCEAYYFIAERRLQANDKTNVRFYEEVLKTKETQLSAYRGAQFALKTFSK